MKAPTADCLGDPKENAICSPALVCEMAMSISEGVVPRFRTMLGEAPGLLLFPLPLTLLVPLELLKLSEICSPELVCEMPILICSPLAPFPPFRFRTISGFAVGGFGLVGFG